jgi:hypothetical protein
VDLFRTLVSPLEVEIREAIDLEVFDPTNTTLNSSLGPLGKFYMEHRRPPTCQKPPLVSVSSRG